MTPERWARIRQTFDATVDVPPSQRAAYLDAACAGDADFRQEVESLLASHQASDEFLNQPAANLGQLPSGVFNSGVFGSGVFRSGTLPAYEDPTGYSAGYRLGPYQFQRQIGQGGMGSVWLATRADREFTRNVAVKLVKRGMDTQEILRRFRLERQLLAGLDHPNIAHLIDGGSTPEGLPYLVMEYVEGVRIDQYCETHQLSISDRLKLFRQVCAAVQFAHQNLVVHRDIKASNILVTGDGTPKLLDFGIAKLIRTEFSTLAAETRPDMRPMTLDYASPEQVRGESITTATDVYSLGVLLFKLLTGKFPYGVDHQSYAQLQKAILDTEPLRPSSVILTDERASIPAATQRIQVGEESRPKARQRLKKKLSGDLDNIILKALRKEALKRYASVEQFSEDVRRYLEGRPVLARIDSASYRTGKFLRRNIVAVAATGAVFLALLAGSVTSFQFANEAERQRKLAEQQYRVAEDAALRQHDELMETGFDLARMQTGLGDLPAAQATYRRVLESARRFLTAYPKQASAHADVARAAVRVGDLAAPKDALGLYQEALAHWEAAGADNRDMLEALRRIGRAQAAQPDLLAALSSFSRALQLAEKLADNELIAACSYDVGAVLLRNNAEEAALPKLRRAFELYRDITGARPSTSDATAAGYVAALKSMGIASPLN